MEATFKIHSTEFNDKLVSELKKIIRGRNVTITISTEIDETEYLNAYAANKEHLQKSIVSEPTITFTPDEFEKHIDSLLNPS